MKLTDNFTPQEWWDLGADTIIWVMKQVTKHFITALDAHLPPQAQEKPQAAMADVARDGNLERATV